MTSHVENDEQKSQGMDVGAPGCTQSLAQIAKPVSIEPNLAQSGEESKVFRITKSSGRA